jgi:tetratricopeptide (TPR) repeat protein
VATSTSAAVVRKRSGLPWGVVAAVLAVPAVVVVVGVAVGAWWATSPLRAAVIGASADAQHDTTVGYRAAVRRLDDALDANSFVRPFARVAGLAHIDDSLASALSLRAYARARLWERDGGEEDTATADSVMAAVDQAAGQPWTVAAQMIAARLNGNAAEAEAIARHSGVDIHALPIPVRVELGRAFAAQGKIAEMLALADALKDTSDVESLVFAGEAYRRVGDHDRARQSLDAALKIDPKHEASRALRALLILEQEDVSNLAVALDDATTLLDFGQESLGNRQRGDATLARALIGQRLHAAAEKETQRDFDTARQLLRGDAEMPLFEALQAKANAFAVVDGRRDWDTPMQLLGDAIQLDPYRVAPYLQLMNVGARAKKFDVADKAYNDARAVFGDNLSLGLARAMSLLAGDKTEEALGHLQNMLKTNDDAEVYRDIGKVWMKKGDLQKSIQYLKKAAEKVSSRSPGLQANVYIWLGRALAKTEDHAQAKEAYAHALAATTEFPSTYYWLGVTLQALSEDTQAGEAFQNYLRADPDGPYADAAKRFFQRPTDEEIVQQKMKALFGENGGVSQLFGAQGGGALEAALGARDAPKSDLGSGTGTLGTGRIGTRGARSDRDVTLTQGTPVVLGSLDPELIRRFVREHAGQIRYCYESELTRTPGIAGKIVVKWVINGEGCVTDGSPQNFAAIGSV